MTKLKRSSGGLRVHVTELLTIAAAHRAGLTRGERRKQQKYKGRANPDERAKAAPAG